MKRILIVLLVIVSVALVFVVSRSMTFKPMDDRSKILEWKFPLPRTHTGVLIGNGVQGLMVWGKGNQLNITVGRAGFWDHRGGNKFKTNTTFQQVKELLMDYDKKAIKTIFSQPAKKEGYPLRPYQLGGGRIEIIFPAGYELKKASLLLNEGALTIYIANKFNQPSKIEIGQSIFDELAWVKTKKRLLKKADIRLVPSYDHYYVKRQLSKIGVKPPEKWADDDSALVGFIQHLPEDKPLSIAFGVDGEKIKIASYLGDEPRYKITEKINDKSVKRMKRKSDRWWKDYWEDVPWLSLPDKTLQEIYDYGLYKQACCHPPHGIPCSLQGPFNEEYQLPPWSNDYHFNINIEMIYWPVLATNRMEHLNPLWDMLMDWMPVMKQNGKKFYGVDDAILMPHAVDDQCQVVGTFWTGMIDQACAAWMSQLAWLHYWYTMDEEILRDIAFPLMKGAFGGYYAMAEKMPDGSLSLPVTVSPEFKGSKIDAWGRNSSFQLSAFKMVAQNLITASQILDVRQDARWIEVLERLPGYSIAQTPIKKEYPADKSKVIALWEDYPLPESHRHHSHMAGIYPFCTINPESDKHHDIIQSTYEQWVMLGDGNWSGWSYPWAASLHARMGNVDAAISALHFWERNFVNEGRGTLHDAAFKGISKIASQWYDVPFMKPHREKMQLDAGFGALDAIHNILLHVKEGVLYVVPEIPRQWNNFEFQNIRVPGAFFVSAKVEDYKKKKIIVKSLEGGTIKVKHGLGDAFHLDGKIYQDEIITLDMQKGEEAVLTKIQ